MCFKLTRPSVVGILLAQVYAMRNIFLTHIPFPVKRLAHGLHWELLIDQPRCNVETFLEVVHVVIVDGFLDNTMN
jgi:hypothetical protein